MIVEPFFDGVNFFIVENAVREYPVEDALELSNFKRLSSKYSWPKWLASHEVLQQFEVLVFRCAVDFVNE